MKETKVLMGETVLFKAKGYYSECKNLTHNYEESGFQWQAKLDKGLYCQQNQDDNLWTMIPPKNFGWYDDAPISNSFSVSRTGDSFEVAYDLVGLRNIKISNIKIEHFVALSSVFFPIPANLQTKVELQSMQNPLISFKITKSYGEYDTNPLIEYKSLDIGIKDSISLDGIILRVLKLEDNSITYELVK